jgi:hypothetical protein
MLYHIYDFLTGISVEKLRGPKTNLINQGQIPTISSSIVGAFAGLTGIVFL